MKLSMWMLADALSVFNPEIKISEGKPVLQGARICSDGINITKSAVYISENTEGQIMLANGHDIIYVRHDDVLDIFNAVLDVFEKCNEWEAKISEEINSGCSLESFLELSCELMPHFFIAADASFLMRASYGNSDLFAGEENFQISQATNRLPLESLIAINKHSNIRKYGAGAYRVPIPNSGVFTAARNLFIRDNHIGWLVVLKDSCDFTQGELDLLDAIAFYAEKCQENLMLTENDFSKSSFLLDIIEGNDYDPHTISEELSAFNWFERDQKQVYVFIEPKNSPEHFLVESHLSIFIKNTFQMIYHDTFVLVVNHSLIDVQLLEKAILNYLKISGGNVGRSLQFENIFMLKSFVDTARIAAQFSPNKGCIVDFSEVTMPYIGAIIRDYSLADTSHPALGILKRHDQAHGTEFYKTLHVFISSERNYTQASKLLNIHRSTLIYRLERIDELIDADLENPEERLHLLMSFYIDTMPR